MVACLIQAEALEYTSENKLILSQVSLSVDAAKVTTIIGPNGAGKTTLLHCLLGLLKPTSGRIVRSPHLKVGYCPQRLNLDPVFPMTVGAFLQGTYDHWNTDFPELGLASLTPQQRLGSLSSGQLQRVLLAHAFMQKPNLLVLDEPAQGMDLPGQKALYALIGQAQKRLGCAVLMVSHDLSLVMAATDHVLCLNQHICCQGRPDDLSQHPELQRLFGQEGMDQLALYTHEHDHHHEGAP